ncbi:MAG: hypothetical protein ACLSHR_11625 [Oscillospiraceae bacterium]
MLKLARKLGIEMPICEMVNKVLFENFPLKAAMEADEPSLQRRSSRQESLTNSRLYAFVSCLNFSSASLSPDWYPGDIFASFYIGASRLSKLTSDILSSMISRHLRSSALYIISSSMAL